jgi:hypothetical protein
MAPRHAASARRTEEAGYSLVGRQHFSRRETPDKLTTSSDLGAGRAEQSARDQRGTVDVRRALPSDSSERDGAASAGMASGRVALLELRDVTKSFGATMALRDISLTLEEGRFHALLGENGAGKSTSSRYWRASIAQPAVRCDLRATELKRQRPRCCARLDSILFTRILPSFRA